MFIPDCRKDEYYNEDFLTNTDKKFVRGYDWCAEEVVDNFFNNMNMYFDDDSHLMHILNEELPEDMQSEEEIEWTFGDRTSEKRMIKTYGDLLRSKILEWIEKERDELITSIIDNMDEDIYEALRNKALKDNKEKKIYVDTRKIN